MSDAPKSPAPKWLKSAVAGIYLIIWIGVIIIDWWRGTNSVPLWYQATGLVVLGYLLGITIEDVRSGGSR